jgi:hypothetical protein
LERKKEAFLTPAGELLHEKPKVMGFRGITTITGIAAEVKRALIINRTII